MSVCRLAALLFILSLLTYGLTVQPKALAISWWPCGNPVAAGTATPTPTPTPSFVCATSQSGQSSLTLNYASACTGANALKNGDQMVIAWNSAANTGPATGWQSVITTDGAYGRLYTKIYYTGDSGSVSLGNPGGLTEACFAAYRGINYNYDCTNLDINNAWANVGSSATPGSPSCTTTGTNDIAILTNVWVNSSTFSSAASGFTDRVNAVNTYGCDIEDKLVSTAGSIGSVHITLSAAGGGEDVGMLPYPP